MPVARPLLKYGRLKTVVPIYVLLVICCRNSQWQYASSDMASHRSFQSDRNPGPLGDLYTSVDRTKDARPRYAAVSETVL